MLCAVPNTEFNLSYESLSSRIARQAIQALITSDPDLHAEITAGRQPVPSEENVGLDEDSDTELLPQVEVSELTDIIMASSNASEVSGRLDALDNETADNTDDDTAYEPEASEQTAVSCEEAAPRRSTRAVRPPSRYSSSQWWNQ